jgi:hypothetical protein
MPLAQDTPRRMRSIMKTGRLPVIANDTLFLGACVAFDPATGLAQPAANTDTHKFAGFVHLNQCDNTGGAASAKEVDIATEGEIEIPVTSVAQASMGGTVYAQDDGEFHLAAGTNRVPIGTVVQLSTRSGYAWVRFKGFELAGA